MSVLERIAALRAEGEAAVAAATDSASLEELRIAYLGRKAELPQLLRGVAELEPAQRAAVGSAANAAREALHELIGARESQLAGAELDARLQGDRVDVTLTQTRRELEDIFVGLGFQIAEGPEIELTSYNFDALNTAPTHPSRARSDTFYVSDEVVLRTHTSPVQVRSMMSAPPPLYVVAPGRVFRLDHDATHTPQFHQLEGLAVDEGITLADLKGTLLAFARAIFGDQREVQLRPDFFPFTEPSVEVDVSCFQCDRGHLRDGSRCPLCKGSGWLEILGAGMVDPNVFAHVADHGYDPERVSGFAFGMGIERIAMLRHGIPDLRLYFDNDLRFLGQFGAR
jgi:phenylalanyl-tRNA synthetase alpha chain